jgi:hypothetical protein
MEGVWFGIIHSLNLIIPRPDDDTHKQALQKKSPPSVPIPVPPPGSSRDSESKLNYFKQFFQSDGEEEEEEFPDPDLNILIRERNLLYPLLQLKDYGRPSYQHLSRGSWELILSSRCFLEEIIKTLALEVSIVSHLPTPDEREDLLLTTNTNTTSPPRQWGLDPSIPISPSPVPLSVHPVSTINRRPLPKLPESDSLPFIKQSNSPVMRPPPSQEMRTIQQRLDARTNIPYRSSDENRIRKHR